MATIGERLRAIRESRKKTQAEVAADLGVSQPTIAMWEAGDAQPRLNRLRKLSAYYGVRLTELLPPESKRAA